MISLSSPIFGRLAERITRHRLAAALVFTLISAAVVAGATRLEVDFSAKAFFGGEGPVKDALDRFQAAFGPDDNVIVLALEGEKGRFFSTPGLAQLSALSDALKKTPGVDDVVSLTTLALPVDADGTLEFRAVPDRAPDAPLEKAAFAARIRQDEVLTPNLVARDGSVAAIAVTFGINGSSHRVDSDDIAAVRDLVHRVEAVAAAHAVPEVKAHLAGTPAVRAALLGLILHDQTVFVPVSFAIMAFLLFFLYRRFHGVFLPLVAAALPSALVMGVMGYLDEPIGVVNQVYFTLLPVIAVSGGIHLLSRYYDEARTLGIDETTLIPHRREEAVASALGSVGGACFFSALTTVIGLFSLQLSSMPILRNFGLYSGIGVTFAFVTLVVLVPVILSFTRGRVLDAVEEARETRIDRLLGRGADISLGHPVASVVVAALLLLLSLGLGQRVVVDNSLTGLLKPSHPVAQGGVLVDEKLAGLMTLEVDLEATRAVFNEPAFLRALLAIEKAAREHEGAVGSTQSPGGIIERVNAALVGSRAIPDDDATVAQLYFLAEGNPLLGRMVTEDRRRGRVSIRTRDVGCNTFVALSDELGGTFRKILDDAGYPESVVALRMTGTALTSYVGVNRLADDMRKSLLAAFGLIILVITAVFRSARIGLIALIPNALPLVLGYALLAVLDWPLEPGPAVCLVVALGIAVDDTIHLLMRRDEALKAGESPRDSIRTAIIRSGRPVIITTVILSAGFGVNMLSAFPTDARVGALGAFVIVVALLADLLVLPPLVLLFGHRSDAAR